MQHDKQVKYTNKIAKMINNEGIVLLKNDGNLLPLSGHINLFGRIQFNYYKSGTGSGGLVNTPYVYSLYDLMNSSPLVTLNQDLAKKYEDFIKDHPFNKGNGFWASEPWSQVEMPISLEDAYEAKKFSEVAVIVIGRTAGEDKDFQNEPGSYQLSQVELEMIKNVRKAFSKVVLVLNVGTIIDLFPIINDVDAIVLGYHGGFYGAVSLYEVLTGITRPSGSLPFSVLKFIEEDGSYKNFGQEITEYEEDIYVGYRYHHTFNNDNILFPFGYGLSYSKFNLSNLEVKRTRSILHVKLNIQNRSQEYDNKTIFFYLEMPIGKLGKPKYELVAFHKPTRFIGREKVDLSFDLYDVASFDDKGLVKLNSYVLEKGSYTLHVGFHIGDSQMQHQFNLNQNITFDELTPIPIEKPFKRIFNNNGEVEYEEVEIVKTSINTRKTTYKYQPNDYHFDDILKDKISVSQFVEGLSDEDLTHLVKGEGMSSPKGTPGIAGVAGGITPRLVEKGIPTIAFSDGPSGIRMDSGFLASSLPNGALMASSFSLELIELLFMAVGLEMKRYEIDILLAPGLNIYRNALNGRNFEYFSEDPIVSGLIAASVVKGLKQQGRDGSLKHFTANNQETKRFTNQVRMSNRAFREIYLKTFEIAIRHSNAGVIMSSYNYLNDYHTASHPYLYQHILRREIGFQGIIISDWWAHVNRTDEELDKSKLSKMVKAEHDLYMVVSDTTNHKDDLLESLENGSLTRSDLAKNVTNMLDYFADLKANQIELEEIQKSFNEKILDTPKYTINLVSYDDLVIEVDLDNEVTSDLPENSELIINKKKGLILTEDDVIHIIKPIKKAKEFEIDDSIKVVKVDYEHGKRTILYQQDEEDAPLYRHFKLDIEEPGNYVFSFVIKNNAVDLSQTSFSIYFNETFDQTYTFGSFDDILTSRLIKRLPKGEHTFSIKYNQKGLLFKEVFIEKHW